MLKTILKTNKQKWTVRTLGQTAKAKLYRQNHTKKHTHTHKKRKRKKYIYIKKIKKRKRAIKSINKSTSDNKL